MTESNSYFDRDEAEFALQVTQYLDGTLDAVETVQLNQLLRENAVKRSLFVELCMTRAALVEGIKENAALGSHLDESAGRLATASDLHETMVMPAFMPAAEEPPVTTEERFDPAPYTPPAPANKPTKPWRAAAGFLLTSTIGLIAWVLTHRDMTSSPVAILPREPIAPARLAVVVAPPVLKAPDLGVLTQAIDAQWDGFDSSLSPSNAISPGAHTLIHGVVVINFIAGGSVVVQGPARFEVQSDARVRLLQGRLCARIPHDRSQFSVITPDLNAVDLGTEFGLNVNAMTGTHLEVFDGQVRADLPNEVNVSSSHLVNANQAVKAGSGTSEIRSDLPTPLAFVRLAEAVETQSSDASALQRWHSFSDVLRADPDLVSYYTFEKQKESPDVLINRALSTFGKHDGTLGNGIKSEQKPRWSTGRWEGKGALQFGTDGSAAVTFADSGTMIPRSAITIGMWLNRDELSHAVHLINGTVNSQTRFNLNLMGTSDKPALKLAANTAYFTWADRDVPSLSTLTINDQWHFLALSAQTHEATRFYVDGKLLCSVPGNDKPMPALEKLALGAPVFGNTDADARDIFRGSIDELMIFQRALSAEEIERIYEAGGHY